MKKMVLILCLFLFFTFGISPACAGVLDSIEKDKYMHFSVSVLISHSTYPAFKHVFHTKSPWLYAFGTSLLFNLAKEVSDIGGTGFNVGDLAFGAAGGITIVVVEF